MRVIIQGIGGSSLEIEIIKFRQVQREHHKPQRWNSSGQKGDCKQINL